MSNEFIYIFALIMIWIGGAMFGFQKGLKNRPSIACVSVDKIIYCGKIVKEVK